MPTIRGECNKENNMVISQYAGNGDRSGKEILSRSLLLLVGKPSCWVIARASPRKALRLPAFMSAFMFFIGLKAQRAANPPQSIRSHSCPDRGQLSSCRYEFESAGKSVLIKVRIERTGLRDSVPS